MRIHDAALVVALAATAPTLEAQSRPPRPDEQLPMPRPRQGPRVIPPRPDPPNPPPAPFGDRRPGGEAAIPRTSRQPKIVCGTTVIQAVPSTDPAFQRPAPDGRRFTLRSVRPDVCRD